MSKYDEQALKNAQKMQNSAKKTLKKAKQKIPQNTVGNGTKTTTANKTTKIPTRNGGSNAANRRTTTTTSKSRKKREIESVKDIRETRSKNVDAAAKAVKTAAVEAKDYAKREGSWTLREIKADLKGGKEGAAENQKIRQERQNYYKSIGGAHGDKIGQFYTGLGLGLLDNTVGIPYSIVTGKKLSESDAMGGKEFKEQYSPNERSDTARNIGEAAGIIGSYAIPYGAAGKATSKAAGKVLSTNAGKKVMSKAAEEGSEALVKAAVKDAIADATVGTTMNLGIARGQGLEGKELADDMKKNALLDFAIGGVMDTVPMAFKALNNSQVAKQTAETVADAAKGAKGTAKVASEVTNNAETAIKSQTVTGGNTRLTKADEDVYMATGTERAQHAKSKRNGYNGNRVLTSDDEIQNYIEDSISGKVTNDIKAYGKVGQRFSDDIKKASGGMLDISDYHLELNSDDVLHSYKNHSVAKQEGNLPLSLDDYKKLADYIDNYDDILDIVPTKRGTRIILGKQVNGYSIITEIVSDSNKSLRFKNMWKLDTGTYLDRYKNVIGKKEASLLTTSQPKIGETYYQPADTLPTESISNTGVGVNTQNASGVQVMTKSEAQGIPYNTAKSTAGTETPQQIPYNTANKTTQTAKLTPKAQQKIFDAVEKRSGAKIVYADLPDGIDGTYQNGVIAISNKAQNPVYTVLKHELTHHIETSGYYAELSEFIQNTMREAGYDVDQSIKDIISDYARQGKNLTNEEAQKEFVAKFAGDYLFNSEKSIERLARENPNVFQRVYDWIVDTIKKIGADDETKFLIDAQRKYEKALRTVGKTQDNGIQYSLRQFSDGTRFVKVDADTSAFDGLSRREQGNLATKIIKEKYAGKVVGADNPIFVNGRGAGEFGFPVKKLGNSEHSAKMRSSTELDNLFDAGSNYRNLPDGKDGHIHDNVTGGFDYYDVIFEVGDKYYKGEINVMNTKNGKLFKDITKIEDITEDISSSYGKNPKSTFLRTSSTNNIPEGQEVVNSLKKDSSGRNLAETDYTARLRNASENLYGERGNKYLQIPQANNVATQNAPEAIPMATKTVQTETQQTLPYNAAKTRKVASEAPESMSDEKWEYLMGLNKRAANETSEEAWERALNEADERYKNKHGLNDEQFKTFFSDPATSTKETKKGQWYERRQARNAYKEIGAAVGIDKSSNKAYIKEQIDEAAEKMKNGSLSQGEKDSLFENILSGTGKEMSAEEKAAARVQFDSALDTLENEMNIVKRYTERRSSDITVDQMDSLISSLGKLKRDAEKTKSKIVLSSEDRTLVDQLLKGNITPEKVREININAHNIIEVYNAEKPVYEIKKALKKVGDETKQGYRDIADDFISGSENWKDKIGFSYARETPERNFVDVAGKEAGERINSEFITPIHEHEASATRMKNDLRNEVKNLNLSSEEKYRLLDMDNISIDAPGLDMESKVSEETLVQLFGEGIIKKEELAKMGADADKIEAAAKTMRGIYNQLIEKANNELIRHGYEPIEFRKDYFPHFSEDKPDGMLAKIGHYLGIDVAKDELPTDIAGLTHTFRPGKKWFGNALQRTGKATEYNAVKGFDLYIEGISDVIYHTEDIQKLRALESEIRFKYSDDGIKKRVKAVRDSDAPDTVKESLIEKIYEEGNTKLGGMATWLRNYTDQLAGKKSQFDRVFEQGLGRGIYNTTKALENRVAANMVALNPGSWLTNFIPLVQGGEISPRYVIEGMAQTIGNRFRKVDDIADISTFLTNRKGSDTLWKTNLEKIQNVLASPMQMIDNFTSEALVRAKYAEGIKKGLNEVDAIDAADRFAADIIADRSKGALPTMFNSKNPISKIFTMYQVEVNNQWSHLMKDIPRSKENVAQVALAFTNFALGAYIFNDVYERIVGRRTALDPISWVNDFVGDATGKKLPNFTEALEDAMNGEGISLEETDKKSGGGAITSLGENVAQDIPFVGGLLEGGRVPISSALPSFSTLATTTGNLISGDTDTKKGLMTIGKELSKPATYILPPVGGGQIKKAIEAMRAFSNGGVYGLDKNGNQQLKFAADTTPTEVAKGLLFGQYAIGNSDDYVSNGFSMLSVNKTRAYQALVESGMKNTEAEDFVRSLPSKKTEMREAIMNSNLTAKQKNAIGQVLDENSPDYTNQSTFAYSQMSDSKQKVVDTLKKSGMTQSKASAVYDVQNKYSSQTEKVNALLEEGYKDAVFEALGLGEKGIAAGKALHKAGVTNLTYQNTKKGADSNNSGNVSIKEAEKYLDSKSYSRAEKYALMKALTGCADRNNKYR